MATMLIGNWGALALRGIAAILFALIALFFPALTATALVMVFGVYLLLDGILTLLAARRYGRSDALVVEGTLGVVIALICLLWPNAALVALIYLIAFWAVISGVALMVAGIAMLRLVDEWLLLLGGLVSVLLGIVLFVAPAVGVVALSWWLGIYALLFGIALLSAAFRLRYQRI